MTTCTPTYLLPYQLGTDRPCDAPAVWCGFADAVETQLDALDAIVDRSVDTIPMLRVQMTVPLSYNNGIGGNVTIPLPFDTVDVDTAGMIDITANPTVINLPRFGRYIVSFQVFVGTAVTSADTVTATLSDASDSYIGDSITPVYLNSSASIRYLNTGFPDVSTGTVNLNFLFGAAGIMTVTSAAAMVYWIGDLP